jgi:hypothetical protein
MQAKPAKPTTLAAADDDADAQNRDDVTVTRHQMASGGHVFQRNERLTKRVGALPAGWEKKLDPVSQLVCSFIHLAIETYAVTCCAGIWSILLQEL